MTIFVGGCAFYTLACSPDSAVEEIIDNRQPRDKFAGVGLFINGVLKVLVDEFDALVAKSLILLVAGGSSSGKISTTADLLCYVDESLSDDESVLRVEAKTILSLMSMLRSVQITDMALKLYSTRSFEGVYQLEDSLFQFTEVSSPCIISLQVVEYFFRHGLF